MSEYTIQSIPIGTVLKLIKQMGFNDGGKYLIDDLFVVVDIMHAPTYSISHIAHMSGNKIWVATYQLHTNFEVDGL